MKDSQLIVLKALFEKASEMMANRGCTDVESDIYEILSDKEWTEIFEEIHSKNDSGSYNGENYLGCDWLIFEHLFEKLLDEKDITINKD